MDDVGRAAIAKLMGEPGTSVSMVDVADLKAVWKLGRDIQQRHAGQRVGMGFGVVEKACSDGADVKSVAYRAKMLSLLVSHAQQELADFIHDCEPSEVLFKAMAQVPMEWMAVGVEHKGLPFDEEEFMRLLHGS